MCVTLITIWSKSADMNENGLGKTSPLFLMKRRACFFIKVEVTFQGKEYNALFRCDSNSFRNLMILFQFTFKGPAGNT